MDREVAIKVAKANWLNTSRDVERFFREARAAGNLRHPHIVPVFDADQEDGQYFIASAFIPGQTLAHALPKEGFEPRTAAQIVRNLAEALAYAHGEGIIHRDVKPANVMLESGSSERGRVSASGAPLPLLMDFGLAARPEEAGKLTQEGALMGTPVYMAPEMARGEKHDPQPASDQYSLGVLFYELLCGAPPFMGPLDVVLINHLHAEPSPLRTRKPSIPRDLETICLKCLEKEPGRRYVDCQAVADDLRRWLEGEAIAARRTGLCERVLKWSLRNPGVAALNLPITMDRMEFLTFSPDGNKLAAGGVENKAGVVKVWDATPLDER